MFSDDKFSGDTFFGEKKETTVLISGAAGQLEAKRISVVDAPQNKVVAILCHPHPQFGGTMDNKVVTTLARTLRDIGIPNVRFNFRGVGKSEGSFDNTVGETDDLLSVISWVRDVEPEAKIWLAGFSFGTFVALNAIHNQLASGIDDLVEQLVLVAPAVPKYDPDKSLIDGLPTIVIQGDEDEVIEPALVYQWLENQVTNYDLVRLSDAGHFFHGRLVELKQILIDSLKKQHAWLSQP